MVCSVTDLFLFLWWGRVLFCVLFVRVHFKVGSWMWRQPPGVITIVEGSSTNVYPYRGYCCRRYTEPEGNLCRVPDVLQNSQKCRVLWYNCHRTHRSVGYCIQISQGNLCGVPDVLQNSQKCRVLWCNCHRTHSSIGYCGTAVTELTDVLCSVKTVGNYPRYRSVGTLRNLSVVFYIAEAILLLLF